MKEFTIILSSTWKFAATFPAAIYLFKMSFFETLLYTNIGGITGIFLFACLSKWVLAVVQKIRVRFKSNKKERPIFTGRNRRMVSIKTRYGLPGIVILTPLILSIPVGVFLITRYYDNKFRPYLLLALGLLAWSFVYASLYMGLENLIAPLFTV